MVEDLIAAVDDIFPSTRDTLERLVRIPSVSAPDYDPEQVRRSAVATMEILEHAGLAGVRLLESPDAHPAVFGELAAPPGAPTVLLYAHHDVQPPGPADEWETPPFEPTVRHGRLFGRGTCDDKSGIALHAAAIRAHGGRPPVGVKVFIEGEEEIGSPHLGAFLSAHAATLAADVVVVADSENWRVGTPALTTSLRGLVDCIVEVRTLSHAVHSGVFGGVFPDALIVLARILAALHDDDGEVAVPGLARGDAPPLDLGEAELRSQAGALDGVALIGSGALTSRMWRKPAVSVIAIDAPPVREAINQLVPVARAKVSLRIAPGDDAIRAREALVAHLISAVPWGADVSITPGSAGQAFDLSTSGPGYEAFRKGCELAWGVAPVEIGVGGSIPFVAAFSGAYPDADILLTGAADPTSRAHGPNESLDLDELRRSVVAEAAALSLLAG